MVLTLNDEGLYQCPVEGCQKAYKPRQSLVSHIKNKHQQEPKEKENANMFDDNSQVEKALADAVEEQELIDNMQEQLINFDDVDMSRYLVATSVPAEEVEFDDDVALGASELLQSLRTQDLRVSLDLLLGEMEPPVNEVEKTTVEENGEPNTIEELVICGECTYLFKTEAEAMEHMEVKHCNKSCGGCAAKDETIRKLNDKLKKMANEKRSNVAELKEVKRELDETKIIMEEALKNVHDLTTEKESSEKLKEALDKQNKNIADKKRQTSDPELARKGAAVLERSASYPVSCNKCDFTCVMLDNLFDHMKRKHKSQNEIIDVDQFGCNQCDESPTSRSELMNHIVEKHSDPVKVVKCEKCIAEFTNENEIREHKCSMDPKVSQWTCHFCKLVFKGVEARDKHVCFKHPYQSVEFQRRRVYRNTTECKWGSGCHRVASNTCWFKHPKVANPQPQEVQVEEHQEGGQEEQEEQEQGWQVPSRRRQRGRAVTRYCSYQENCDRRDTCKYKHIESLDYMSSTIQENF